MPQYVMPCVHRRLYAIAPELALCDFTASLERVVLPPDTTISWEGEPVAALLLLSSGELELMQPCEQGESGSASGSSSISGGKAAAAAATEASAAAAGSVLGSNPPPPPSSCYMQSVLSSPAIVGGELLTAAAGDGGDGGEVMQTFTLRTRGFCMMWKVDAARLAAVLRMWPCLAEGLGDYVAQQAQRPDVGWVRKEVAPEAVARESGGGEKRVEFAVPPLPQLSGRRAYESSEVQEVVVVPQ